MDRDSTTIPIDRILTLTILETFCCSLTAAWFTHNIMILLIQKFIKSDRKIFAGIIEE